MRTTKKDLEAMVQKLNRQEGFTETSYNTIGAYTLYKDACGYALHQTCSSSGGVRSIAGSYGLTARDCYYLLAGMLHSSARS